MAALRGRVTEELLQLVSLRNGEPLITKVWKTEEIFPGPATSVLPDLIAEWSEELPVEAASGPATGTVQAKRELISLRAGWHRPEGFLIAKGPGLPKGLRAEPAHLLDLPPTVFRLLGLPPHESLEGVPIADLVTPLGC